VHLARAAETQADTAVSITSSLGSVTSITSKPLANNAIYTKGSGAVHPEMDFKGPMYVTASVSVDNGAGGQNAFSYLYNGARTHWHGRGFLGFDWMEETLPSGVKVKSEYRRDWPYAGLPSRVTRSSGSVVLSEVTNTYGCMNPATGGASCTVAAGNRYFPYVAQSVEVPKDLNGSVFPTVTTANAAPDQYGNFLTITVSTSDGFSKVTTNTYTNDTTNWFLGRLTRSSVQSTAP